MATSGAPRQLLVVAPNIDSLPFRWFGSAWNGLDLPRHLTHFAPWTLQLLLERAGFTVEAVYGGYQREAFTSSSAAMVFLGRVSPPKAVIRP